VIKKVKYQLDNTTLEVTIRIYNTKTMKHDIKKKPNLRFDNNRFPKIPGVESGTRGNKKTTKKPNPKCK